MSLPSDDRDNIDSTTMCNNRMRDELLNSVGFIEEDALIEMRKMGIACAADLQYLTEVSVQNIHGLKDAQWPNLWAVCLLMKVDDNTNVASLTSSDVKQMPQSITIVVPYDGGNDSVDSSKMSGTCVTGITGHTELIEFRVKKRLMLSIRPY